MTLGEWAREAACRDVDTRRFYQRADLPVPLTIARLCASCPARRECADHAIAREPYGIWAGLTELEREAIRVRSA